MRSRTAVLGTVFILTVPFLAVPALAQEEIEPGAMDAAAMEAWMKASTPGPQHEALARLSGAWDAKVKFWMDPSAEPETSEGTIHYEMIMDGRYLKESVESDFMGEPFKGMGLYGYNNVTGELQAIWVDDMSTGIYSYTGSINEAGDEFVLTGTYKDPVTGQWKETRSVNRVTDAGFHYVAYEKSEDGEESKMMEITGTRQPATEVSSDAGR